MAIKHISVLCEGKTEKILLTQLKVKIIDARLLSFCKKHSLYEPDAIHRYQKHFIEKEKCCKTEMMIFDKDELDDAFINKVKSDHTKHATICISYPCIEIILLNIFKSYTNKTISKNDLNKLLEQELRKHKILNKYEHGESSIISICNYLIKNKSAYNTWLDNLEKLKLEGVSNFIDVINYLSKWKVDKKYG